MLSVGHAAHGSFVLKFPCDDGQARTANHGRMTSSSGISASVALICLVALV